MYAQFVELTCQGMYDFLENHKLTYYVVLFGKSLIFAKTEKHIRIKSIYLLIKPNQTVFPVHIDSIQSLENYDLLLDVLQFTL